MVDLVQLIQDERTAGCAFESSEASAIVKSKDEDAHIGIFRGIDKLVIRINSNS